jgi:hypothetical protein
MGKPLGCRLGWHKWVRRSADGGSPYRQCARCGKDDGRGKANGMATGLG